MGTRYRVAVERIEDTPDGTYSTREETLFEATHTDPARLARLAPEEVVAVLAEAACIALPVPPLPLLWASGDRFTVPTAFKTDGAVPEEMSPEEVAAAGEAFSDTTPARLQGDAAVTEKPKRVRRTKAQKAADDAAQALGYRDAAHRAEAQAAGWAGAGEEAGPAEPIAAGGMPTPQSEAATAEVFGLPLQPAAPEAVIVDPFAGAAGAPADLPSTAVLVPDPYPADNYNPAPAQPGPKFDPFAPR